MTELGIERSLKEAKEELYDKYKVLKNRLLNKEYEHWAASFPTGNNHGPSHIKRVLEYLNHLLGAKPLELVKPRELFLAMMSSLYHDTGILRGRKEHAAKSALFVLEDRNTYILNEHEREIVSAVVASHSGTSDIETECSRFSSEENIGGATVRPHMIAALVRLADELDEDYRRADPILEQRLSIPNESKFFWRFCQRIRGIELRQPSHQIIFNIEFKSEDIESFVCVDKKDRPFLSEFANKLVKINKERVYVNKYLPEELHYRQMLISVKPLKNHDKWKRPREFVFNDHTSASEFVASYPELLAEPAAKRLSDTLELIRDGQLKEAKVSLQQLEKIGTDLPEHLRIKVFYDIACVESLYAKELTRDSTSYGKLLKLALTYLEKWLTLGLDGAWQKTGKTPYNEIYNMGNDGDLWCVLSEKRDSIMEKIPKDLQSALSSAKLPNNQHRRGSGCVLLGTTIQTPMGSIPVEELREGDKILSLNLGGLSGTIVTRVAQVHTSREPRCIRLNRWFVCTPTQPLYAYPNGWVQAIDLSPGMCILDWKLKYQPITHVEQIEGYFEVFNLTTDHPSHNYVAYGLVCRNKKMV